MADLEVPPAASRNFAVAMIHEGNALKKQGASLRQWPAMMLRSRRTRNARQHT
jgi:hypothetical protein